MSWWAALPAIALAVSLLCLPGLLLSAALGFRGSLAVGLAPAFSVALVGVGGILLALIGAEWSLVSFVLAAVILSAVAAVLYRLIRGKWDSFSLRLDRPTLLGAGTGLLLGAASSAYNLWRVFDFPDNIAQRYDNVFHLNAVRFVLEQGEASSLTLGRLVKPDSAVAIYPAAWHGFAALVADIAGQPVTVASNALNIAVTAVAWPIGALLLARVIFGPRPLVLVFTGFFSAGFPAFPLGLIDFGPLYPNLLSYSVLPASLALVLLALKARRNRGSSLPAILLALPITAAALFLAQPNGFSALLALSVPAVVWSWWSLTRSRSAHSGLKGLVMPIAIGAAVTALFVVVWNSLLIGGYDSWLPFNTYSGAIGEALTSAPHGRDIPWVIAACTVAGLMILIRNRTLPWLLGMFAVAVFLYAVSAAEPRGLLRMVATGSWYQDPQRLASLLPIPTVLIAGLGATWIVNAVRAFLHRTLRGIGVRHGAVSVLTLSGTMVLVVAGAVYSQRGSIDQMVVATRLNYTYEGNPTILSRDEQLLLERLDEIVPADSVIGVNPWNGSSLAYAFSGIPVTQYHLTQDTLPPDLVTLATSLDSATAGSDACSIANKRNVEYVLDFGTYYLLDRKAAYRYPAFDGVQSAPNYELVDEQGSAKLYRVENCF